MPNTPMLVGEGVVVLSPGPRASRDDISLARRLFSPAATVIELAEARMNAVTAISGSGPAYVFWLVEQMIAAGVELGLDAKDARTLAIRTAAGAAKLLASSDEQPAELRRRVTSPGGTTEAAISALQSSQADRLVIDAIKAAEARGRELASRSNS
jgi:pyrroline-5-carboxylate reductase